jgi:hypothetical protein
MIDRQKRKKIFGSAFVVMFVIGFWLSFILPGQLANKEYNRAMDTFQTTEQEVIKLKAQVGGMQWYKKIYSDEVQMILNLAQEGLDGLRDDLTKAKAAGAGEKKVRSQKANNGLAIMQALLKKGQDTILSFQLAANEARLEFGFLQKDITELQKKHGENSQNVQAVKDVYLSKYIKQMTEELSQAGKNIDEAESLATQANVMLPPVDDKSAKGDPAEALKIILKGKDLADGSLQLIKSVSDELMFQKEALLKAEPGVASAKQQQDAARDYLGTIVGTTSLLPGKALKKAYAQNEEADKLLAQAKKALVTKVEKGKRDLADAYRKALQVIELSGKAIDEADNQVRLYDDSCEQIQQAKTKVQDALKGLDDSAQSQNVLMSYHSRSAWEEVAGNFDSSGKKVKTAAEMLKKAESSLQDQAFPEALDACKQIFFTLDAAGKLLSSLRNQARDLESYRGDWPDEERKAKGTINDEEDDVDRYGGYSSSAKDDFEEAKELLRDAQSLASDKDYASAVAKAQRASNLAEGTGRKARNAYDDSQRSASSDDDDTLYGFGSGSSSSSNSGANESIFGGSSYDGESSSGSSSYDGGGSSGSSSYDGGGASEPSSYDGGAYD